MKKFIQGKSYVPVSGASITDVDVETLHDVVNNRWYTEGEYCKKFEAKLHKLIGKRRVILTNSGSSASLLAISTIAEMSSKGEDYIVTCSMGFPTTCAPIYQVGKIPIYIDIDPYNFAPSYEQLEQVIEKYKGKIAGVVLTHNLGFPFDEIRVEEISTTHDPLITMFDCCDALGAKFDNIHVGKYDDVMTLSFFPAHHVTCGEGGAILTDNDKIYEIARSFSNWGRSCDCLPGQTNTCGKRFEWETDLLPVGYDHKYIFDRLGYNLKMTEFQAGLGYSQIQRIDEIVEKRVANYYYLLNNLFNFNEWLQFPAIHEYAEPSPFGFPIMVYKDMPFTAQELIQYLEDHKVRTRRFFGGNLTKQPAFQSLPSEKVGKLEGADFIMNNGFWIGCHPELTKEMLDYVVEIFDRFFKEKGL